MIESGFIDQLAFLVSKTTLVRTGIMYLSGLIAAKGLTAGSYSEVIIASSVTVVTGSLDMFINHVRNKYAAQIQKSVGARVDSFIGPATVEATVAAVNAPPPEVPVEVPSNPKPEVK